MRSSVHANLVLSLVPSKRLTVAPTFGKFVNFNKNSTQDCFLQSKWYLNQASGSQHYLGIVSKFRFYIKRVLSKFYSLEFIRKP